MIVVSPQVVSSL